MTGTVSGAAKLMNVSQPNVSRMLKYLEGRLGLNLFERHGGRLLATQEAHTLFHDVDSVHNHLVSLDESIRRISAGEGGRFCIGTSPSLGRYVVPRVLAEIRAKYPSAALRVDVLSVAQISDYLSFGQGEFACTIFPIEHPNIETLPMTEGRLMCVLRKNHRLARSRTITARSLAENVIGFDSGTPHGDVAQEFFRQAGIKPKFPIIVRFAETACALVEQGLGVALVDEFTSAGPAFPSLSAVPVKCPSPFRIYLHRHREHATSILGSEFCELMRRWDGAANAFRDIAR